MMFTIKINLYLIVRILGNSYLGRYNQTDVIENIPTISDIFEYYHVFNINSLTARGLLLQS